MTVGATDIGLIAERPDAYRGHPDLRHVLIDPARRVIELQFVGGQGVDITRRHSHRQQPCSKAGSAGSGAKASSAPDVAAMLLITSPTVASTTVRTTGH